MKYLLRIILVVTISMAIVLFGTSICLQGTTESIEEELIDIYAKFYSKMTGEPISKATNEIRDILKTLKDDARKEGTDKLPNNFGTLLVKKPEVVSGTWRKIVETARSDGATNKDIEEWWNLHDLQRRMVIWSETIFRYANFVSFREDDNLNPEDAMAKVRAILPMYGDPNDTTHTSGEDRPLCHELRGRVDCYRERHGAQKILKALKNFKTYNAFVRSEMRAGRL